jgi:superfamily I DNA/RNA helicase
MSWMVRYDNLDEDQRDFVDNEINKEGNIWLQGFAGSGKSIMLIYALERKLKENSKTKVCIVVYTHALIDMFKMGMTELEMQHVPIMTYHRFMKTSDRYDYIFCDEVQDLPKEALINMRNRSSHVLVAGDANQSIYESTVSPSDIQEVIAPRTIPLRRIHRLTRSIINAVSNMLPNLDIFGAKRDMTKQDVNIRLLNTESRETEVKYIWNEAKEATANGYSATVLLPTGNEVINFIDILLHLNNKKNWTVQKNRYDKNDYSSLNNHLNKEGIKAEYVGNSYGSFTNAKNNRNLIIMTYHSSKGMDFENVFLPFLSSNLFISYRDEETLLMVAMTRSNKNLYITYSGILHHLVKRFEATCQPVSYKEESEEKANDSDINIDFGF